MMASDLYLLLNLPEIHCKFGLRNIACQLALLLVLSKMFVLACENQGEGTGGEVKS